MAETVSVAELKTLFSNASRVLLAERRAQGHWEGELSSSALSTATAVVALGNYLEAQSASLLPAQKPPLAKLVQQGLNWLAQTQNPDGGWGDTVLSKSNISTTALVWAAFARSDNAFVEVVARCAEWIRQAAGTLEPRPLAQAIERRYGRDRTFSVPILTTLALTGRLGTGRAAWGVVPQLPFELAACPHQWFARLKLPVVSYALPALIAIGQVRHHHRPSRNPVMSLLRRLARQRTLRVLQSIQPTSGGFLEATPLTSFVVLSLVGAGEVEHPVVRLGVDFLVRSVRADGSWPIDTNLATWVTTLAVNALSTTGPLTQFMTVDESVRLLDWLRSQQYQVEHPYTHAAPGGWAWTDLTGGVPDADDTPGALLALWNLGGPAEVRSAAAGVQWLLNLQNADGGMPTFCRGWGVLPFDRSSADLTAHALRAWGRWEPHLPPALQKRIRIGRDKGLQYLRRTQRPDGAWAPLWFGNQHATEEENLTYGTSRVLLALVQVAAEPSIRNAIRPDANAAVKWLLATKNSAGGWGGAANTPSSIEETALAVEALCAVLQQDQERTDPTTTAVNSIQELRGAIDEGFLWLNSHTQQGCAFPPSPIGFYFAKLWYYEKLYPLVYTLAAVGRAALSRSPSERV